MVDDFSVLATIFPVRRNDLPGTSTKGNRNRTKREGLTRMHQVVEGQLKHKILDGAIHISVPSQLVIRQTTVASMQKGSLANLCD
jgi:hypothetical protein